MVSVMRRVPNPVRIHCGLVSILGLVVVSAVLGCGSPGTICSTCSSTSDGGARRDGGSVVGSSCRPPSTTWKLVNGGVAGSAQAPLSCQKPIKTSTLPSGQVRALGVHQVGEVVSFDVPAGTGTISIVSQASSGVGETITVKGSTLDNAVVPLTLADPSGDILYDDNAKPPTDGSTAKVYFLEGPAMTGVMTLPNTTKALTTSASGYPAGNWSLTVNDWAAECAATPSLCTAGASGTGTYDVTVLLKPITGSTGTVDLAFYFVTASLTAAQALTDSHVQRYLSTLAVLYGRAGLCLGTITFYDVPSWAKNKWATGVDATKLGPCDGLDQMFTISKAGNALNFFLVDSITQGSGSSGGGQVVGIDGAIPGPSSIGGTVHSGAVVNFSDYASGTCAGVPNFLKCGADVSAYITAHEGGHWMGLYHTTEGVGGYYDPLSDTAKCSCSTTCGVSTTAAQCCYDPNTGNFLGTCSSGTATYLSTANCIKTIGDCGGGDSLMFYLLGNESAGTVSAQQGAIIRANPVVY